jgi:acyl-CoA synthetase (NDP forming)
VRFDRGAIARILAAGRGGGALGLRETEGMAVLAAMGIAVPRTLEVRDSAALDALAHPPFPGERVAVKVVSPAIAHKTDVGGVAIVSNTPAAIRSAVAGMERRFADKRVDGFAIQEFVPHESRFGHELLVGMRWTNDFGPVVTVGPGGVSTEALSAALDRDEALAILSPALAPPGAVERALGRPVAVRLLTERQRGQAPAIPLALLADVVRQLFSFAGSFMPDPVSELEVNPLVVSGGRLVALDALVRFAGEIPRPAPPRPLDKLDRLLGPRSVAVMGVSEKMNPGRIILRNLLRAGTAAERITVIKAGRDELDGCRCVPSLEALPARVDLLILSIAAAQVPGAITSVIEDERAESVILIPGGLDEKPEGRPQVAQMRERIATSRETAWRGPVINGGNCLGVRSAPGRYNTLFIPAAKMPVPGGAVSPVALISGSGAFTVSKISKLAGVNARYVVSIGNQMDLTLGDYLEYLADDRHVELFAVYSEGFRVLDGLRFMQAAARIAASGRTVVLYHGGRTPAGASAAASHTAAVAGDFETLRQLAREAGVVLAESLDDFEDCVRLFASLGHREVAGFDLGAVSNAGFECVAIADNLGAFRLAPFAPATVDAIGAVLERARLGDIVTPRNPIDLTPIMADADYEEVVRSVLLDPGVQAGLIGCVPLTGALNTLEAGEGHTDDVTRADSLASRLVGMRGITRKPWVAVVDGGRLYDAMARRIEDGGVPVFRTADRALRVFNVYCAEMIRRARARGAQGTTARVAEEVVRAGEER